MPPTSNITIAASGVAPGLTDALVDTRRYCYVGVADSITMSTGSSHEPKTAEDDSDDTESAETGFKWYHHVLIWLYISLQFYNYLSDVRGATLEDLLFTIVTVILGTYIIALIIINLHRKLTK